MDANIPISATGKKSFTRFFPHIARVLMGLMLLGFGILGLLVLLGAFKVPDTSPQDIKMINAALTKAGYIYVVSGTMTLVGVLLLINRFVPLALALIAPILVGILTFHITTQPAGIGPVAFLLLLELYLAWSYRSAFCPMLKPKVTPGAPCE